MKKLIIAMFSVLSLGLLSMWIWFAFVDCTLDFTSSELSYLEWVNWFIIRNEHKFSQYFPWTESIVLQFTNKIENTIACNQDGQYFTNKRDFDDWFYQFVMDLVSWTQPTTEQEVDLDDSIDDAILDLQWYLIDMMTFWQNLWEPIHDVSNTTFTINLSYPEYDLNNLYLNLDIDQDWKYNLQESEFETNVVIWLDLDVDYTENEYEQIWDSFEMIEKDANITVDWSLDMDILMKDDLFIKLNNADINYNTEWVSQIEDIVTDWVIESLIEELKWKYINTTEWTLDMAWLSIDPTNMINNIQTETMIEFYKEWDKRYWRFKPEICDLFNINMMWAIDNWLDFSDAQTSCENKIYNMKADNIDRWYLIMNKVWTIYSLWFTQEFIDQNLYITQDNQEIISWNSNEITKFNLNLNGDLDNHILYENWVLDTTFASDDYILNMNWEISNNSKKIDFDFSETNDDLLINWDLIYSLVWNTYNISLYASFVKDGTNIWDIQFTNREQVDHLNRVDIQKPTETTSVEELEELLSNISWF